MKRVRILGVAFFLCGIMVGCGPETREGLVADTIKRMELAASEVGNITSAVETATKAAEEGKKLDFTEAGKAAEKLKETGTKIVEIKQRIDIVRASITDDEKKTYADSQKESLNKAFETLLKRKTKLHEALAAAEQYDKLKVDELRKKIVDAESPFAAQAR